MKTMTEDYLNALHTSMGGTQPNVPKSFGLSDKQVEQITEWQLAQIKRKDPYLGTAGGRFSYHFYSTGIGAVVEVQDGVTGANEDFTDYDTW
jgi:hypothetical protein